MGEQSTEALLREVLERLDRLEARMEAIQHTADGLRPAVEKLPVVVDAAGTMAQTAYDEAVARGVDPIAASLTMAELAAEAARPEALATLQRLLARQALLHKTLDVVDRLEAEGALDALMEKGAKVAPKLTKLMDHPAVDELLDLVTDQPQALEAAAVATDALVETRRSGWSPAGLFAPLTALLDADIQKAAGFALAVAKRIGQKL